MSTSPELEELKSKRTAMEEESRLLDDKERNLDERVRILEEKIAIQELEDHNKTKLDAIKELESKICDLEKRLKKPSEEPKTEPEPETFPAPEEPEMEVAQKVEEEPTEEYVEVTPVEDTTMTPQFEEIEEDAKKQHEKKKRRLF